MFCFLMVIPQHFFHSIISIMFIFISSFFFFRAEQRRLPRSDSGPRPKFPRRLPVVPPQHPFLQLHQLLESPGWSSENLRRCRGSVGVEVRIRGGGPPSGVVVIAAAAGCPGDDAPGGRRRGAPVVLFHCSGFFFLIYAIYFRQLAADFRDGSGNGCGLFVQWKMMCLLSFPCVHLFIFILFFRVRVQHWWAEYFCFPLSLFISMSLKRRNVLLECCFICQLCSAALSSCWTCSHFGPFVGLPCGKNMRFKESRSLWKVLMKGFFFSFVIVGCKPAVLGRIESAK